MKLEIHDNEIGNTLTGRVPNLDYDYQAEEYVFSLITGDIHCPRRIEKFLLIDEQGERAAWERDGDYIKLVRKSPRFEGTWMMGHGVKCSK